MPSARFAHLSGFAAALVAAGMLIKACGDGGDLLPPPLAPGVYAFVLGQDQISIFKVDESSGALSPVEGSSFPVNPPVFTPTLGIDPSVQFVYFASSAMGKGATPRPAHVLGYAIRRGSLIPVPGSPFVNSWFLAALIMHPSRNVLYARSNIVRFGSPAASVISVYGTDAAHGAISLISEVQTDFIGAFVVHPEGRFLYATHSGAVGAYAIDATSGNLSFIGSTAGGGGSALAVHPGGRFLYVTSEFATEVSAFSVDASTGVLTSIGAAPASGGSVMAVEAQGKFLYVAADDSISTFVIDSASGMIAPAGSTAARGTGLRALAADPAGRFLYLSGNLGEILRYSIDATTGAPTPLGTVSVTGAHAIAVARRP